MKTEIKELKDHLTKLTLIVVFWIWLMSVMLLNGGCSTTKWCPYYMGGPHHHHRSFGHRR